MAIVLEGPDRAGKSTLAEEISQRLHVPVKHLPGSSYEGGMLIRHWDLVEGEMALGERGTVYDRMVLGSLVYAFKKDRKNVAPVTPSEYLEWLTWMKDQRNVLICALPPIETILERMKVGEDYITQDEMITVYRRYGSVFSVLDEPGTGFTILKYDSSVTSAAAFVSQHQEILWRAVQ